jgi:CubicO group peptidase (beta-lactamase class C family)
MDQRLNDATWTAVGASVPSAAVLRAEYAVGSMIGVVAAGYKEGAAEPMWAVAGGFADIDSRKAMTIEQAMLVGSISKLITAVSVLRLVGNREIGLHDSANEHLHGLRVGSDAVTIHQLLIHTAGVSSAFPQYAQEVPSIAELIGPELAVDFAPGSAYAYSNGGYAVLGEIISPERAVSASG